MTNNRATRSRNISSADIETKQLALSLYERAVAEGRVPPIRGKGRGRPPRDWRVAAKVAAWLPEIGPKKMAEWLEKNHPYRVRAGEVRSAEAGPRRVKACIEIDAARKAAMLRPGAADEVYRSPEERLARLDRLISHYVGLAYEQWLRVEKTMDD